ncbi:MAG: hypothetical protein M1823_002167 [Watsoniomyces obsoletus]|nr:MAG: hypothetical protein M1823_002167 [Watsoniomyces obsoletus]
MELSRKEYPEALGAVAPAHAVAILNDRVKRIGKLNAEVSEWIQERRKVEELYAQGLRKLARRQLPNDQSELGVFTTPWSKIVGATESMSNTHQRLAQRLEADVERPLKEFMSKNREMQSLSTIQGNLSAMAKEVEMATEKTEKLKRKGGKASAAKVAAASSELENANSQWISQAPFVFENLQAADETRTNFVRDVLTQLQTHELDWIEQSRTTAEECLNELLNVEASNEVRAWAARATSGRPRMDRQRSKTMTNSGTLAPPPSSSVLLDDSASQRSRASAGPVRAETEGRSERFGGLRRLGTVMGRRKNSAPSVRTSSPEKRDEFVSLDANTPDVPPLPTMEASNSSIAPPLTEMGTASVASTEALNVPHLAETSSVRPVSSNADTLDLLSGLSPNAPNGTSQADLTAPRASSPQPSTPTTNFLAPPRVSDEGFSKPGPANDPISQAEQEAASDAGSTVGVNALKLDIRKTPIQEEDGDVETAMANVASALRAHAAPSRRTGTPRGRRDVRNTVFVPSPQISDVAPQDSPGLSPAMKSPRTATATLDEHTNSDAQSVRSAHSLQSHAGSKSVRHPEMPGKGLNASIVEAVSATFAQGQITKALIMGELAMVYNAPEGSTSSNVQESENVRLENFHVLEKVAPNPTIVAAIPDTSGEYAIKLAGITRNTVAFKYQVHLDENSQATHLPIIITPAWRIEPHQASVILQYALNPAFVSSGNKSNRSMSFHHVTFSIHLEGAKTSGCQSKPVGVFTRERSVISWQLGDVTLEVGAPASKLVARFATEAEGKPGNVETKWEIRGDAATGVGSQLKLSRLDPSSGGVERDTSSSGTQDDPFADENRPVSSGVTKTWKEVPLVRRLVSGKYIGT